MSHPIGNQILNRRNRHRFSIGYFDKLHSPQVTATVEERSTHDFDTQVELG